MEHISLDGVIQHSADDGDFPYSDWTVPYRTPAGREAMLAAHGESFDLLLGRRTYDIWSGFWPMAPNSPLADRINSATKYIVSHRPESLKWGPFKGLGPNFVADLRRIKSQDGPDLILWGSSTLTSALLEHGLADEVLAGCLPGPCYGQGKALLCGGYPGPLVRTGRHESNAFRGHPQYLQGRRAVEDRIVAHRHTRGSRSAEKLRQIRV